MQRFASSKYRGAQAEENKGNLVGKGVKRDTGCTNCAEGVTATPTPEEDEEHDESQ